jgi:hypothetical protein
MSNWDAIKIQARDAVYTGAISGALIGGLTLVAPYQILADSFKMIVFLTVLTPPLILLIGWVFCGRPNEYRACHAQEHRWRESLKPTKRVVNDEEATDIMRFVCSVLECPMVDRIDFGAPMPPNIEGQYSRHYQSIVLRSIGSHDITLIAHELAHHVHGHLHGLSYRLGRYIKTEHGRRFLNVERRIFRVIKEWDRRH